MGQYHLIANFDKKEYLESSFGLKLTEFSWQDQGMMIKLEQLMRNEWKGDTVLVIGDYCSLENVKSECSEECFKTLINIYHDFPYLCDVKEKLYNYIGTNFKEVKYDTENYTMSNCRYIVNSTLKQYVDLADCPIQYLFMNGSKLITTRVHPLPILLAICNGMGGSDYYGDNHKLAGSWCASSREIEFLETEPTNPDFKKLNTGFNVYENANSEKDEIINTIVRTAKSYKRKNKEFNIDVVELQDNFIKPEDFEEYKKIAKSIFLEKK